MAQSYAYWILRWRIAVVLITLGLAAWAASGMQYLHFKTDYRMFFSEDNPQLKAFETLQNKYSKNDNILFVLAPKDGDIFTVDALAAVENITGRAWQMPYSRRVDSMTNFQYSFAEGDQLVVDNLVRDAERLSANDLERLRAIVLHEPLLLNRLVSPRGHVTGINVTVELPGVDTGAEVPEVVTFARTLVEAIKAQHPGIDLYLTGSVAMDSAFAESSEHDTKTLVPLMIVVITVAVGLFLRTVMGTLVTVATIFLAVLPTIGLAAWLGIALSPPSVAAPNIILTLAVADCVHILASFFQNMRQGMSKHAAMVESLRINFQPVLLTSLTTAIGFLSMNFSDAPPFRDLGNITALGVGAAYVLSMSFLPAAMMLLPVRVTRRDAASSCAMTWLADIVVQRRKSLLWGMTLVTLGLISWIPNNELNDEFVKYFDHSVDFRRATDFTTDNLTGIYYIDYSLWAGATGSISDPAFLKTVEDFANWYREQPETLHVYSITDIFKRLNKNMHGDDDAWRRLPETRELAAQYLLLYEMSLPYGLDLNDRISVDKRALRLSVTLRSLSSNHVLALERRAQEWLAAHAPPSMQVDGSSPTVMFAHIGQRNINTMLSGVLVALALISFTLVFALRSVKIGLLSLVPNLVPVGMAFGLWGLVVGQVGLALSVVAAMTLGVVVDDTVHFLSKYLRARRERRLDAQDAVRYAYATVGTAMWVTSVVLMAGFSVLAFSSFEINAGMGLLTAIAIGLALLADFLFLPPLLMQIEEKP